MKAQNTLEYKGYVGVFAYIPDDEEFHGQVMGLRDVIHFSGRSVEELRQALADSVEDYLEFCKEVGKNPEKPHSGTLTLRIPPELHSAAATAATAHNVSLNTWIAQTIEREAQPYMRRSKAVR